MTEVTVKVPDFISDIVIETGETIYVEALKEVAGKRLYHTQKRLNDIMKQLTRYESKYDKSCQEYLQNVPDTIEGHDDWADWTYLVNVYAALQNKTDN